MNTISDNQLMANVKAGDLDKLGVLFERYKKPLYRYFYLQTGNCTACEDLVQSVFMRIIKYRDRFRPIGEFRSWMFRIAHNLGVDYMRRRSRSRRIDDVGGDCGSILEPGRTICFGTSGSNCSQRRCVASREIIARCWS